ncbi:MAG: hypothetical protein OXI25_07795 [Chloroflexota bacterium]|nr:hypothetical protein [Chloroflexota bacterium]
MALRRAVSALAVAVIAAAAFLMLDAAQPWVGDWVAPVWLLCGAFVPFLIGLGLGPRAAGAWQPVAGGVLGALVGAVPGLLIAGPQDLTALTYFSEWEGRDYAGRSAIVFLIAGVVACGGFGATALPVGIASSGRLRRRKASG